MPEVRKKKFSLRPIGYDEISLVDDGAAGSAHVLIAKRRSRGRVSANASQSAQNSDTINISRKPPKGKGGRDKGRSQSNPCSTSSNSTGAKTGDSSQRAQNWKDERHKRDQDGQFSETPQESKSKYGKGGTTKAKMDRACRSKKGSKGKPKKPDVTLKTPRRARKGKVKPSTDDGRSVAKRSAMSTWDTDAQLMSIMERKAAPHGR